MLGGLAVRTSLITASGYIRKAALPVRNSAVRSRGLQAEHVRGKQLVRREVEDELQGLDDLGISELTFALQRCKGLLHGLIASHLSVGGEEPDRPEVDGRSVVGENAGAYLLQGRGHVLEVRVALGHAHAGLLQQSIVVEDWEAAGAAFRKGPEMASEGIDLQTGLIESALVGNRIEG